MFGFEIVSHTSGFTFHQIDSSRLHDAQQTTYGGLFLEVFRSQFYMLPANFDA